MIKTSDVYRKYRTGVKVLRAKFFRKHLPLIVSLELTRRCNQSCVYCGLNNGNPEEMDTKKVLGLIDELSELGTERISFTGGEPLLREDFSEISRYARHKDILTMLNTNGSVLGKFPGKIANISRVNISLDGPKDIHDKIKYAGTYDRAVEAVNLCKCENIPVSLCTVLSKYNLHHIEQVLDIARELQVNVIFQPATRAILGKKEMNPIAPDVLEYRKVIYKLLELKKRGEKSIFNSAACLKYLYRWPGPARIPCWAAKLYCRITCTGDIYLCGRTLAFPDKSSANCLILGVSEAFNRLKSSSCGNCWCASMVELNLVMSLNMNAALNLLYQDKFRLW